MAKSSQQNSFSCIFTKQHIHLNHFSKIQFLKSIDCRKKFMFFTSKKI